jgi:rubrerythrin
MEENHKTLCKRIEHMLKDEENAQQEYYELEVLLRECPVEIPEMRELYRRALKRIQEDEKAHYGELLYLKRVCSCEKQGD